MTKGFLFCKDFAEYEILSLDQNLVYQRSILIYCLQAFMCMKVSLGRNAFTYKHLWEHVHIYFL